MTSMRHTHACPMCQGEEIVHVPVVRDSGFNRLLVHQSLGFIREEGFGEYESYFCRSCGYAELYVKEPKKIPLDRVMGARVLRRNKRHPYR